MSPIIKDGAVAAAPSHTRHISWSQVSQPCDLQLKFHRDRVPISNPLGIGLLYGQAFHRGIEASKKDGASLEGALETALAALERVIKTAPHGVRWDELKTNQDGSPSARNLGKLPNQATAEMWLRQQLPEWLALNEDIRIVSSEQRIRVPLTRKAHWTTEWELEGWLDLITDQDWILDVKTTTEDWDQKDLRKYSGQARLYMGAFTREYGRVPAGFEFQVVVRGKQPLSWEEANKKAFAEAAKAAEAAEKGKGERWPGGQVAIRREELLQPTSTTTGIYNHRVDYEPAAINLLLNGRVKPRIDVIEAGAFAANPDGWWCSSDWCRYYSHCAFGDGQAL